MYDPNVVSGWPPAARIFGWLKMRSKTNLALSPSYPSATEKNPERFFSHTQLKKSYFAIMCAYLEGMQGGARDVSYLALAEGYRGVVLIEGSVFIGGKWPWHSL
jgi:hypothetical protein